MPLLHFARLLANILPLLPFTGRIACAMLMFCFTIFFTELSNIAAVVVVVMKASSFIYANNMPLLFPGSKRYSTLFHGTHSFSSLVVSSCFAIVCALFAFVLAIFCTFNNCNCGIVALPLC